MQSSDQKMSWNPKFYRASLLSSYNIGKIARQTAVILRSLYPDNNPGYRVLFITSHCRYCNIASIPT